MYFALYKARLKCLCKNPKILFWSFGFPVLLAIFYYMGFYNLPDTEGEQTINIAVVRETAIQAESLSIPEGDKYTELINSLKNVKLKSGLQLFFVQEVYLAKAKELLENEKIAAYIIVKDIPVIYVKSYGVQQNILESNLTSYLLNSKSKTKVIQESSVKKEDLMGNSYHNYMKEDSSSENIPNIPLIYFYSLLAFACVFGSKFGFREMSVIRADGSFIGVRVHVSPVSRPKLLLCHLGSAFTLQYVSVLFLLAFLIKILRIEFGGHLWMLLLTCFVGSLCGITLGAMICVVIKANEKVRIGALNSILLCGWFLSGMVIAGMKYILMEYAPLISYINPFSLITDAFYYLYYYDGYAMFFMNINFLLALSAVFGIIAYLEIRRKEYASV